MHHHKSDTTKIKKQNHMNGSKKGQKQGNHQKRSPKKITPTYLHNSGLYYLERFSASKSHFITVMSRKAKRSCLHHKDQNYDECVIMVKELADKFENLGLLNDDVYTNAQITSLRRKGLSRNGIVQKMQIKGISRDKTIGTLEALDQEHHETEHDAERHAALTLARKRKIGPYSTKEKQDENLQKSMGIFARAGFSYHIAKSILEMTSEDLDV